MLEKAANFRIFRKSPANVYLRINKWVWDSLPARARDWRFVRAYGKWLNTLVRLATTRRQYFGTFFLRNRPMLELIRRLAERKAGAASVKIAVLGCSAGAEVYSILWALRSTRPDLSVCLHAVDISQDIVNFAKLGVYDPETCALVGSSIFERMTGSEKREMFDWVGNRASVKAGLREGIEWMVGDAGDPKLVEALGPQDIVVASNFLCHMPPADAERCLRNMVRLAGPNCYLFVSGVDLDVRTKVALDLGLRPIPELLVEIHDGDSSVRRDWPMHWWGLEPLDRLRPNWQARYAAAFQVPAITVPGGAETQQTETNADKPALIAL